MFMFWSVVWAFVILSFLNGIIHWQIPEELQIPDFLLKTVGGFSSFYGYKLELDIETENLTQWLQAFVDDELENLPSIEFKASQNSIPKCSLTKSSRSKCISTNKQECNRFDESCAQFWQRKGGHRVTACFDPENKQLNCNSNGYFVKRIYHNQNHLLISMAKTANQMNEVRIEEIQNCQNYYVKQDNQTLISIPIPEMQNTRQTQELHLRQNMQKSIFYPIDEYNQNLTLLWTLFQAHLNTTKFCTCSKCYDFNTNLQIELGSNKTVGGLTAQLVTESNGTTVNLTTNWKENNDFTGLLEFRMQEQIIDKDTPMFWRRPGRFDCPSEVTCPLELFYIFKVQSGLLPFDYFLEICFIIAVIVYQRKYSKRYF